MDALSYLAWASMQRLHEEFFNNEVIPSLNANESTRLTSFPTLSSETDHSDERFWLVKVSVSILI